MSFSDPVRLISRFERRQIVEDMLAQRRQDPALDMQHSVAPPAPLSRGLSNAGREALDPVMVEQIGVGLVQDRLVARRVLITAALMLSGTTACGAQPMSSKQRTCEAHQSSIFWLSVASA